jgi:hypothetical protein
MSISDFLNLNLAAQCQDLAGEINKVYQRLDWALQNEIVQRLKRQAHRLAQSVQYAQDSKSLSQTEKHLEDSLALVHELVPLMDLCLRKNLLSPELQKRWILQLKKMETQLRDWLVNSDASK